MLIDREDERMALEREYERDQASFVVVYGRRRIGKTSLLVDFLKDKCGVYFLATEESEAQNRATFKGVVADFLDDDLIRHASFDRWDDLFDRLTQDVSQRIVIVLDEFQYLGKANNAFLSVLQRIWDSLLRERNVMLVLCGSLISLMVEQTLAHGSPLYGRRTAQLHMRQLPFSCYGEFFPEESSERKLAELFSVTGGVPKYIELFDAQKDIYASIAHNVLDRSSFLYDEPNFLLQREVGEVGSYFSIIKAIAAGNRKTRQDSQRAGNEADQLDALPENACRPGHSGARGSRHRIEPPEKQKRTVPHQRQLPAFLVPLRLSQFGTDRVRTRRSRKGQD